MDLVDQAAGANEFVIFDGSRHDRAKHTLVDIMNSPRAIPIRTSIWCRGGHLQLIVGMRLVRGGLRGRSVALIHRACQRRQEALELVPVQSKKTHCHRDAGKKTLKYDTARARVDIRMAGHAVSHGYQRNRGDLPATWSCLL